MGMYPKIMVSEMGDEQIFLRDERRNLGDVQKRNCLMGIIYLKDGRLDPKTRGPPFGSTRQC